MLATSEGDLLGRKWYDALRKRDENLLQIAREVKKAGGKLNRSRRYRQAVGKLRGYVDTEIRRTLNRLVEVRAPRTIVLGRLDFNSPTLSRRPNRIVTNCGRSIVPPEARRSHSAA
jgi:putative transposase